MSLALVSISGMTCGACTASINEAVSGIEGVSTISVSLITEEAKVVFDESKTSATAIVEAIENCGFDAQLIRSLAAEDHHSSNDYVTTVSITGMTCGACSASITDALEKLDGVSLASISLITASGSINHTTSVSSEEIIGAIEDCGFDAKVESSSPLKRKDSQRVVFSVKGMTCGACSASISAALQVLAGVTDVSVSLITEEAQVRYEQDLVSQEQIREAIEDCGFEATLSSAQVAAGDEDETCLQIFGINDSTDLSSLQYNIEALLGSLPGIYSYNLAFKGHSTGDPVLTDANSSSIQAMRSEDLDEGGNLIDELFVTYSSSHIGIRVLVDSLNNIADDVQFLVVNSVDQSLASQLKLLSRVKDIQYWRWNFLQTLMFGAPVVFMSHTQKMLFWKDLMLFPGLYLVSLLQLLITTHIQFNLGSVFFKKFFHFVKRGGRNANMDVLVCISTLISYFFSVLCIALSVWYGQTDKPPKLLFETSSMLIAFISMGKWFENKAKGATSTALSKLLSLTPSSCTIVENSEEYEAHANEQSQEKKGAIPEFRTREISIDLIQMGDIAVVIPGGKIPADGVIVFGESEIDESIITGESMPVYKTKGDNVIGGSINGPDLLHMRVTRSGKKSQLQQIISLVKDSQVNKAPVQRFADYVAARFVPSVLILAALTFCFWLFLCYFLYSDSDELPLAFKMEENGKLYVCLKLGISVIVVACPCALGLAAPTAVMVGTGVGASNGVLIKGGDVLEKASHINVILFDKTGTLTTGDMAVVNSKTILPASGLSESDWWSLVGSVECNSEHPIGRAITKAARKRAGLAFDEDNFTTSIRDFKVLTGLGIKAIVELQNGCSFKVSIGNNRMIDRHFQNLQSAVAGYQKELHDLVNSLAHVIINDEYSGFMELTDSLKPNAKEVIDYLRFHEHYQVGIVTGDSRGAALKVGRQLGIPENNIFSDVSPVNKDKVLVDLKRRLGGEGNVGIAFVGDGINDAPALAQADIGLAISSGTDIAIDSADIVLIGGQGDVNDLSGVPIALKVSHETFQRIKMNFLWATIYNLVMLPFAMGCFLPLNVMLPPIAAGGAMAFSSVSVVVNSLMLKNFKRPNTAIDHERDVEKGGFDLSGSAEEFALFKRQHQMAPLRVISRTRDVFRKRFGRNVTLSRPGSGGYELLNTSMSP